jgi:hypothetical protein
VAIGDVFARQMMLGVMRDVADVGSQWGSQCSDTPPFTQKDPPLQPSQSQQQAVEPVEVVEEKLVVVDEVTVVDDDGEEESDDDMPAVVRASDSESDDSDNDSDNGDDCRSLGRSDISCDSAQR